MMTISELSRRSGVPTKTLRYWEQRGLLPQAQRSHTGYRLFSPESLHYIGFIRRSKSIGLTLGEMRQVLRLARAGRCPCPEVVRWSETKIQTVEGQIRSLEMLLRRLRRIRSAYERDAGGKSRCRDVCGLIEGLPEARPRQKGGELHAQVVACTERVSPGADGDRAARAGGRGQLLSPRLPALPLQVSGKQ